MKSYIIFIGFLATVSSSPIIIHQDHYLNVPLARTTSTHSSQMIDHGSTYHSVPVIHKVEPFKKTITRSSQVVNHGGTTILHTPVHYELHNVPVLKTHLHDYGTLVETPVVHSPLVYHSSPVMVKSSDSAVSHHSSTVHETVPVVNSIPLYTIHH